MAIGYGYENPADFEEAARRYREQRFGTTFERDPQTGKLRDVIRVGEGAERLGEVGDAASILGAATYGRLNPNLAAEEPPPPPPEPTPSPAPSPGLRRMLPAEDQSAILRSIAPVSGVEGPQPSGYDPRTQYPGGVSPPLSGPGVEDPRTRTTFMGGVNAPGGPTPEEAEALKALRTGPLPSSVKPTARDINRSIFDRLKALDFAGALRVRNEAARNSPELFAPPPRPEREFEPRERPPQAEPEGQAPTAPQPAPKRAPAVTSPLRDFAARYGYGTGGGYVLPGEPGQQLIPGAVAPREPWPPAGFTPGLPPGMAGIPENDYAYNPQTGKMISRTKPGFEGIPLVPAERGARTRTPIDALLEAASADVPYLRGEPFRTNEEQAMVERAKGRIRANADLARQRAIDEAGAYNAPLGPRLREIDEQERLALNEVDQQLLAATAGERRSRLAESRNLLSYIESLERTRMMEAMGIEQALEEGDFQRVAAILQAATGGQAGIGTSANVSGNILNYALGLGGQAREALGRSTQGLQDLSTLYWLSRQNPTVAAR